MRLMPGRIDTVTEPTPKALPPLPLQIVSESTLFDWAGTMRGERIDNYPGASQFIPHAAHSLAVRQHLREALMVLLDAGLAPGLRKRIVELIGGVGSMPPQFGA
jgi:hypothetical protein